MSAGHVQTVAVRLVVEREREIESFVQTEYWTIIANLSAALPPKFDARLYKIEDLTVKTSGFDQDLKKSETHIKDEQTAKSIVEEAEKEKYTVEIGHDQRAQAQRHAALYHFKTAAGSRAKIRVSGQKSNDGRAETLRGRRSRRGRRGWSDNLYATDSTRVSDGALAEVRDFIDGNYGKPETGRKYREFL